MYNEDQKRELIMKHYTSPLHKGRIDNIDPIKNASQRCVDNGEVYISIENDTIKDIKHLTGGCAVYLSSSDIIANELIGKNTQEALKIITDYENMINELDYSKDNLGDLIIYDKVGKQLNRAMCALTASSGYIKLLKENI